MQAIHVESYPLSHTTHIKVSYEDLRRCPEIEIHKLVEALLPKLSVTRKDIKALAQKTSFAHLRRDKGNAWRYEHSMRGQSLLRDGGQHNYSSYNHDLGSDVLEWMENSYNAMKFGKREYFPPTLRRMSPTVIYTEKPEATW